MYQKMEVVVMGASIRFDQTKTVSTVQYSGQIDWISKHNCGKIDG